jgi:hypothetical protein
MQIFTVGMDRDLEYDLCPDFTDLNPAVVFRSRDEFYFSLTICRIT